LIEPIQWQQPADFARLRVWRRNVSLAIKIGLESPSKLLAGLEKWDILATDGNGSAGFWIACLARISRTCRENAEAPKFDATAFGKLSRDGFEKRRNYQLKLARREAGVAAR